MSTEETALLQRLSRVANEWHCFPMSAIAASEIVAFQALADHGYVTEANAYSFALTPAALDVLQMLQEEQHQRAQQAAQQAAEKRLAVKRELLLILLTAFITTLFSFLFSLIPHA